MSPELPGSCRKEFKENKEPSPKAKRKRGVKISSVALDSMHWQNDSVQIIASASDLKSMDEFLLKKMNDLDNEDSKKDTLVDVVFKKALKEFRQNIFSSYSSALAVSLGHVRRYSATWFVILIIYKARLKGTFFRTNCITSTVRSFTDI